MLMVYGALMPLRLLEEIRFWKMQEKEHTVVIRELAPKLEPPYVQALKEWEPIFANSEFTAGQLIEAIIRSPASVSPYVQQQIDVLSRTSVEQSNRFIEQLQYILTSSAAIQADPTAQVVIQHIIRESEYFLGVLHSFHHERYLRLAAPHPSIDAVNGGAYSVSGYPYAGAWRHSPISDQQEDRPEVAASANATGEGTWSAALAPETKPVPIGGHTLPPLPYAYDALEPFIDTETMKLHHDKHHKSYVDGLNKAEKMLAKARQSGDFELIKHWEREAAFHGAGHYLHTIFWNIMAPKAGGKATGPIAAQIDKDFGSFDKFKKHFTEAADKVEGGGWALLVWGPRSHRLEILQAEKHQNLSQWDVIPLLVLDVWEHAYYLKHQNNRAAYISDWWNVVNWKHVNDRFTAARVLKWQPF